MEAHCKKVVACSTRLQVRGLQHHVRGYRCFAGWKGSCCEAALRFVSGGGHLVLHEWDHAAPWGTQLGAPATRLRELAGHNFRTIAVLVHQQLWGIPSALVSLARH